MTRRTRVAALFAAAGLLSAATSAVIAVPQTYSISVSKTASPAAVPTAGGTVVFTVWVTGTGSGFFQTVVVTDTMVGCTVAGPFGDQPSAFALERSKVTLGQPDGLVGALNAHKRCRNAAAQRREFIG